MKLKKCLLFVVVCLFYSTINNWSSISAPVCSHTWSRDTFFQKKCQSLFSFFSLHLTWIWASALKQLLYCCYIKNQSKCLWNNVRFFFFAKSILFLFNFYFLRFQNSFSQVEPESSAITVFLSELQESGYFYFSQLEAGEKRKEWQRERVWVREGVCGCVCECESVRVLVFLFLWGPTLDGLPLLGAHFVWPTPTLSLNLRVKV